jgi:hypothetical protein
MSRTSCTLICIVMLASELFANGCKRGSVVSECEGAEREKVDTALASIQRSGFDCGMRYTMDNSGLMTCMKDAIAEINQRREEMSEACQTLFDTSAQRQAQTPRPRLPPMPPPQQPPSSTMCQGGVCCDHTGCYGG